MSKNLTLLERAKKGWSLRDSNDPLDWIKYKLYYDPSNNLPGPISGLLKTFGTSALGAGITTSFIPTIIGFTSGLTGGYIGSKLGGIAGSLLPTKSKVTLNINQKAGETIGSVTLSLPFGSVGANLTNKNYRQGLIDWFKYRNLPNVKSVFDEYFKLITDKPGVKYPNLSQSYGLSKNTKWYETNTNHGKISYGVDKESGTRILAKVKDDVYSIYGTIDKNPYVFRPHWEKIVTSNLVRAGEIIPSGTYIVDSDVAPFGALLRNANKSEFVKLLFAGPQKTYMDRHQAFEKSPNSYSSYIRALKQSSKPDYELRYNNLFVSRFNNNDFGVNTASSFINESLINDPVSTVPWLNHNLSSYNQLYQPITITNREVAIPIPVVLKK